MRPIRSSYTTFAPRIEHMFWALHAVGLTGLTAWIAFSWARVTVDGADSIPALCYLVLLVGAYLFARPRASRFALVFWPVLALDLVGVGWLIHMTGGVNSSFYLLYFAIVPLVAFYQGIRIGLATAVLVCAGYFLLSVPGSGFDALPVFAFRAIMLGMFTAATGFSAQFIKRSEIRLLNALDKLNERTTELEHTYSQLETIYETTRSLGELLAEESVIDRVLAIARSVLNYPVCEVCTWDAAHKKLWLKGRVDQEQAARLPEPKPVALTDVFRSAITEGEVQSVVDRQLGRSAVDGFDWRSQLVVPMITEGRTVGLLNVQSPKVNAFSERDERVLSVLAASAGLALVNADLHQRMEKLTIIDELTGVYNFRYFRTRFEDERRRAVRYKQPLSLVMVDIDWFKNLNDRYGHETGNCALKELAEVIQASIRDVDVLSRYGGEEFIVILPHTGVDEAHVIGERIRRRIERTRFCREVHNPPLRITVSIGVSCYPENGQPEHALVQSVDQALYRAKEQGKNLVCTY